MKRPALLVLPLILLICASYFAQTAESRWAKFDGNRVHFLDTGDRKSGEAIVFIHGWMCNADFWSDSINAFPNQRVIAVDLIGHGKSDKPKVPYTIDLFARSVASVLKEANVNKAVLVGHSMGTPVVYQVYRLRPDKVRALVIVDGSLRPYFTGKEGEQFLGAFRKDYKATSTEFVNGMLKPVKDEDLKKKIRDAMLSGPDYVGISAMEGLGEGQQWKTEPIKVPVLAIYDDSGGWPADNEAFLRSIASKLDYQSWKGVSHFLMMERASEFNGQLKMFMMKNKIL